MVELSVIVPIYKVEKYLKQCVNSILAQTYTDFELILVDDGSPDGSGSICDSYAQKDQRVKAIHKENGGLVSARKAGIAASSGKYVTYVDGDDWISSNTYEVLMKVIKQYQVDVVTAGFIEEFETDSREYHDLMMPGYYSKEGMIKCMYGSMIHEEGAGDSGLRPNVWSKIFRREIFYDCQMSVDERINYGEDMACSYPALLRAESVYVTDECLYHYRRRAGSMTNDSQVDYFEQIGVLYKDLSKIFRTYKQLSKVLMEQLNRYMKFLLDKGEHDVLNGIVGGCKTVKKPYYLFPYEMVEKSSKVIIYGAGIVGQDFVSQLNHGNYAKVVAWVDKKYAEFVEKGLAVSSIDSCTTEKYDYIVIAILKENIAEEIRLQLLKKGVLASKIIWKPPVKVRQIVPKKKKIAFAIHRYGKEVNGGAELHCRVLAQHLRAIYDVEILTSCALDVNPWDNYYKEGTETIDDIVVRRFEVKKHQDSVFAGQLYQKMNLNKLQDRNQYFEENGPYCPDLIAYIKENYKEYQAVIFFSYGTYISSLGLQTGLDNGLFIPTVHEDTSIRSLSYKKVFQGVQGFLYNSYEEREMVRSVFDNANKKEMVTCIGIDEVDIEKLDTLENKKYGNYIIYVGRISTSKNCHKLFEYFLRYKQENPSDLKLVLIGKVDDVSIPSNRYIVHAGFVSEKEKMALIRGAKFLVNHSINESLSLVILESMILGRPVVVNGNCAVMKGQCLRSNAGLYYENYLEFEGVINYLLTHKEVRAAMGKNGISFVKQNYIWPVVIKNVSNFIETYRD